MSRKYTTNIYKYPQINMHQTGTISPILFESRFPSFRFSKPMFVSLPHFLLLQDLILLLRNMNFVNMCRLKLTCHVVGFNILKPTAPVNLRTCRRRHHRWSKTGPKDRRKRRPGALRKVKGLGECNPQLSICMSHVHQTSNRDHRPSSQSSIAVESTI